MESQCFSLKYTSVKSNPEIDSVLKSGQICSRLEGWVGGWGRSQDVSFSGIESCVSRTSLLAAGGSNGQD